MFSHREHECVLNTGLLSVKETLSLQSDRGQGASTYRAGLAFF